MNIRSLSREAGFTLIELVLTTVLVGIISAGAVRFYVQGLLIAHREQSISDALGQAQVAIERIVIDVRQLRSTNDISIFTGTQFSFTDLYGNAVNYQLSGTDILCNSQILARGVNSLAFTYYDLNGVVTATAANVRYIKVNMNVTRNSTNFTLTTSIYPRALIS